VIICHSCPIAGTDKVMCAINLKDSGYSCKLPCEVETGAGPRPVVRYQNRTWARYGTLSSHIISRKFQRPIRDVMP